MNPGVAACYESVEDADLFLSRIFVLGELRKGVEQARSQSVLPAGWVILILS